MRLSGAFLDGLCVIGYNLLMINYVELAFADQRRREGFKHQVQRGDGIVQGAIHPHYLEDLDDPPLPRTDEQKRSADLFYGRCITAGIPTLLFLGLKGKLIELTNRDFVTQARKAALNDFSSRMPGGANGTAYVVFTYENDPLPLVSKVVWPRLVDAFDKAGVGGFSLSGRHFVKLPRGECEKPDQEYQLQQYAAALPDFRNKWGKEIGWLNEDVVPFGCVGKAGMLFMSEGFKVDFSICAAPGTVITPEKYIQLANRKREKILYEPHSMYPFGRTRNLRRVVLRDFGDWVAPI